MFSLVQGVVIAAALATVGCGSSPPPPANPPPQPPMQQQQQQQAAGPVTVNTTVVVNSGKQAEDRATIAMLRDGPIPESPLLVDAEYRREEHEARLAALTPPAPQVVIVRDSTPHYQPAPYYVPTPSSVVIVRDLPTRARRHDRGWYDRNAARCDGRRTDWARDRCLREVARR